MGPIELEGSPLIGEHFPSTNWSFPYLLHMSFAIFHYNKLFGDQLIKVH